ncbi:hypothetical protein evm_012376 [Chilo suppressalis]|nr:hypothetical protein evm_012376 [Chilo suppressalis]
MSHYREPTVVGMVNFNAAEDAAALRAAMKGFGTDEQAIIDILTTRSNAQRQAISQAFTHEYGRDLIEDLKSELGGHFEDVIVALMMPPEEYLCKELHHCMSGMGTDEETLVEILCTRTKREIADIVEAYERLYDRPLAEHMCSETSGDFRRLLTLIVTILAHESFAQLQLIFEAYKGISGRTIEQAIKAEIGGELKDALSAIVECVENAPAWFAQRLRKAMEGAGTEDRTLVRIIASRAEIDLGNIKAEYERIYDKTLESDIKGETSGDYKRALVALIGPA